MERPWHWLKKVMALLVLVGIVALAGLSAASTNISDLMSTFGVKPVGPGLKAPDFTLRDISGKTVSLKDFKGKLILLNFWATWCTPCRWEMPEMQALYQVYKDQGFVIVAVSLDKEAEAVARFVKEAKLTYPILLDSDFQAARAYRVPGPPTTFLIGPDGEVKGIVLGPKPWGGQEALRLIAQLLAEAQRKR